MATAVTKHRAGLAGPLFAVFLALHGIAHFAGLSMNIRSIGDHEAVGLLGGALAVSNHAVLAILAVAWAALGAAFLAAAVMIWRQAATARRALIAVTTASLAMCILSPWAAVIGMVIDAALLAVAFGWPKIPRLPADAKR